MESSYRVPGEQEQLLQTGESGERVSDIANGDTFRNDLYALKFPEYTGSDIIRKLELPIIVSRRDLFEAIMVHHCLKWYPGYEPKIGQNAYETTVNVIREAIRLVPGYTLMIENNAIDDYGLNEKDVIEAANKNELWLRVVGKNVYYPTSSDECIMFWKPLMAMDTDSKLFKILKHALFLLQALGFDNVVYNNRMDMSLWSVYDSGGDVNEQVIDCVIEDYPDELMSKDVDKIKDKAKREKEIYRIKAKWAQEVLDKEHEHMKTVEAFWEQLKYNRFAPVKKAIDFDLLRSAVKEYYTTDTDISAWISHLLMLHENDFRFTDFIIFEDHEEVYPVIPDHCIGLAYDSDNWQYIHHNRDVSAYADQYGFFPLASSTEVYPGKKKIVKNVDSVPIASWVQKALHFNLLTLKY